MQYSQFRSEFRDEEVYINYIMAPAERDVGIMREYVDEFHVTDLHGLELQVVMTEAEEDAIIELCHHHYDSYEPEDPYDPTDQEE